LNSNAASVEFNRRLGITDLKPERRKRGQAVQRKRYVARGRGRGAGGQQKQSRNEGCDLTITIHACALPDPAPRNSGASRQNGGILLCKAHATCKPPTGCLAAL